MKLPYDVPITPHIRLLFGRSFGWLVGRLVGTFIINFYKGGKLHFHAPIGALVLGMSLADARKLPCRRGGAAHELCLQVKIIDAGKYFEYAHH